MSKRKMPADMPEELLRPIYVPYTPRPTYDMLGYNSNEDVDEAIKKIERAEHKVIATETLSKLNTLLQYYSIDPASIPSGVLDLIRDFVPGFELKIKKAKGAPTNWTPPIQALLWYEIYKRKGKPSARAICRALCLQEPWCSLLGKRWPDGKRPGSEAPLKTLYNHYLEAEDSSLPRMFKKALADKRTAAVVEEELPLLMEDFMKSYGNIPDK